MIIKYLFFYELYGVLVETLLDKTNDHKWSSREDIKKMNINYPVNTKRYVHIYKWVAF